MSRLSEVRARAWIARRAKYGQRGHAGSYSRVKALSQLSLSERLKVVQALIVRLHNEAVLSEGQCCKALDMDRVAFRELCDSALGSESPDSLGHHGPKDRDHE